MLGRAASCCDLLRLSPTPGDSSEDDGYIYIIYIFIYNNITTLLLCENDVCIRIKRFNIKSIHELSLKKFFFYLFKYIYS